MKKKPFFLTVSLVLVSPSLLAAEPFCYIPPNGGIKCIYLSGGWNGGDDGGSSGGGSAGGGGCGTNQACRGGNSMETDWMSDYLNQSGRPSSEKEIKNIMELYNGKSIQLQMVPLGIPK